MYYAKKLNYNLTLEKRIDCHLKKHYNSVLLPSARSSADRVLASEAKGRGFDPRRARHSLLVHL